KLAREPLHQRDRRPGNILREVEAVVLLRLAEILRVKQLLQADDLRAALRCLADLLLGPREIVGAVGGGVVLNEADRERFRPQTHSSPRTVRRTRHGRRWSWSFQRA